MRDDDYAAKNALHGQGWCGLAQDQEKPPLTAI
jgi:hypothetical protein